MGNNNLSLPTMPASDTNLYVQYGVYIVLPSTTLAWKGPVCQVFLRNKVIYTASYCLDKILARDYPKII